MQTKRLIFSGWFLFTSAFLFAQDINKIITEKEVERIERKLASDEMRGRKTFSPEIDSAAAFIAAEFKKIGLQTINNSGSYLQQFSLVKTKTLSTLTFLDGIELNPQNVAVSSNQIPLLIDENSRYETAFIKPGEKLNKEAFRLSQSGKNMIVFVDSSYAAEFSNLSFGKRAALRKNNSVVFLLTNQVPKKFSIDVKLENTEQHLSNVLGILPGKNKYATGDLQSDDIVVFSAHYDHIGVGKPVNGDSIYNGANDDASGTTAVMMLAKYFKELNNNDRTLVFVAFTAEEIGGYGSQYFSKQVNADGVVAMFNIEMIGTESKWGNNSAYITGYDKTDMGEILNQDLRFSGFTFYPDPYPDQQLFFRSDNATLALLGVPAHTISTSKMDSEPNYHKQSDSIETLDLKNMTEIIKAIAISSKSIVAGESTPSRVKTADLR